MKKTWVLRKISHFKKYIEEYSKFEKEFKKFREICQNKIRHSEKNQKKTFEVRKIISKKI